MPTNFNEGTPRDPNVAKQLNKLYRNSSAPESNTYQASRKKLESSFRAEPSARPSVQINRQPFTENIHSASRPQGYEDKAAEARQQASRDYLRRTGQVQEIARGARNPSNFISKSRPVAVFNSPGTTFKPAIPGAGIASGIASLGIGYLVDRYATPYLMNAAQNAGGILGAELHYKLGDISESELSEALRYIREGNGYKWGDRINQIRTIQRLAKRGIKLKNTVPVLSFTGGQLTGVSYTVVLNCLAANGQTIEHQGTGHWGKIGATVQVIPAGTYQNGDSQWIFNILSQGLTYQAPAQDKQDFHQLRPDGYLRVPKGFEIVSASVARVIREDGKPDVLPTQPLSTTKYIPVVPSANNAVYRQATPVQTPTTIDKPPEINKAKPTTIVIPSNVPVKISSDNESVQLVPSTTSPSTIEIPHPRTIPSNPDEERKTPPLTISSPTSPDIKLETFGSSPVTIAIPGYNPITVNPQSNQPQGALPIQDINRQYAPVSSTATPTKPGVAPTPTPTTPATPEVAKSATTDDLEQFKKDLEKLILTGGILAGLTPAIQTIGDRVNQTARQTTPEALETAAAAGTCRTTQPGGCTTKALDDAVDRVNQNTNDKLRGLDAAAQLEQLNLLNVIDNKLGAGVPGGISGFLQRAFQATRLDKILNALTFITTLHNAAMLSRSLGSTLGDLTGQALSVIGIKDENNSPIDINAELGKQVNNLMSALVGAEVWAGTKTAWNKANTIISTASQIVYTVRSIADSAREVTEWIANNTGKIGNALKRFRVVGENAFPYMSENVTHQNAWMLKVQRYREGVDSLDDAASSLQGVLGEVQNIQQESGELLEQKQKFDKTIEDAQPKKIPESKPIAADVAAAKLVSKAPADAGNVFRGEGETPNA